MIVDKLSSYVNNLGKEKCKSKGFKGENNLICKMDR